MDSSTVNISFSSNLLKQIDKIAKEESRSRSELIREAARLYIERKKKWNGIFTYGKGVASAGNINEDDIIREINDHRRSRRKDEC